ncbi:ATP-binding protein [Pseudoxanthomonas broegbernensis]|uniref:histidine kinase n=1 Tax=Pseudoxanthomonas broegbernensis TaxID=83619 RepID=A0A7V8GKT9_9GAMM|nr:sensor histidine kinase [Pseudoxanthomonas broegbernensis]KAF1685356.1 ATP-binding protein [Pseudoxanthomonas broegbernensis]MBB6066436.1 signal transduction histidine kinase [Pseudoxanthomonas broegbernensis]
MNSGSLRWRLMLGAAAAMLAALTLALFVMSLLFSRHIERRVAEELKRDALRIAASLDLDPAGLAQPGTSPSDPRYDTPAGGRYWQLSTPAGTSRSLSLWDESLPAPATVRPNQWHVREANGPFGQRIMLLERQVSVQDDDAPITVQLAQNTAELRVARDQFRRELGRFLIVLWLMLMAAAWIQIHLGLRPLRRLRNELERMQRSPSERMDGRYPSEVTPLTSAINRLAEARERDVLRARRRAADLAHSLKTPLAAMGALSRRVRATGQPALADDLDRVIATAGAALEAELARSRAAAIRDSIDAAQADPNGIADRIIAVVQRTERGGALVFNADIDATLRLPIANDDLMEVLGALIENATRFARRQVLITGLATAQGVELTVEDDGPGLNISTEEALTRGGRLDETGSGNHGLGLSIARDIIEATQGTLALGKSGLGGLQVRLAWRATSVPGKSSLAVGHG